MEAARSAAARESERRPTLLFFRSARSGPSRRVEAYLAQVLQRRQNHDSFRLVEVDVDTQPGLAKRFGVARPPTLLVVDGRRVSVRLEEPRGCVGARALAALSLRATRRCRGSAGSRPPPPRGPW